MDVNTAPLIAAAAADPEMRALAVRRVLGGAATPPEKLTLFSNPHLEEREAAALAPLVTGEQLTAIGAPRLRERIAGERGTPLASELCATSWLPDRDAAEILAAAPSELIETTFDALHRRYGTENLFSTNLPTGVLIDALERWYHAGGKDLTGDGLTAELVAATPTMRAEHRAWFDAPDDTLDSAALIAWLNAALGGTARRIVATSDVAGHPNVTATDALTALSLANGTPAAPPVAARVLARHPDRAATVLMVLAAFPGHVPAITEVFAASGAGLDAAVSLLGGEGPHLPSKWLCEIIEAYPAAVWATPVRAFDNLLERAADPLAARAAAVLGGQLTARLGELAPAALGVLTSGFNGTFAQLAEVAEAAAADPHGAGGGPGSCTQGGGT